MITKSYFGRTKNGETASLYTIQNAAGTKLTVSDFGAILVSIILPDGRDVVLGYDNLADYEENRCFFGATIGRNANRIGGASFDLNGEPVRLKKNEGENNLHTDFDHGFHKVMWSTETFDSLNTVRFSYISEDGECGFPGNLSVSVSFHLSTSNSVQITYEGLSDKDTVFNLTNHSYFNLAGHETGSIEDTFMVINADSFTELGEGSIPTGKIIPVDDTPMDFRNPISIGSRIGESYEQLVLAGGYDHNYCLRDCQGLARKIAQVMNLEAGVGMDVFTDLPGVQFYTGNYITPQTGKNGAHYDKRSGFCLETQYYPDSVNKDNFAKPFLKAGERRISQTSYHFIILEK